MRKHCKRIARPASGLITRAQHEDLMLAPRMHLEMVLSNIVNLDYQRSVMGVFNLAIAMAALEKKQSILKQYDTAQTIMGTLITSERSPTPDEGDFLRKCFNMIDRHIDIQSAAALVRAIEFVDRMIAKNVANIESADAEALST